MLIFTEIKLVFASQSSFVQKLAFFKISTLVSPAQWNCLECNLSCHNYKSCMYKYLQCHTKLLNTSIGTSWQTPCHECTIEILQNYYQGVLELTPLLSDFTSIDDSALFN